MKSKINKESVSLPLNDFPVVGIGASAGGLAAFKKLIRAIPENSGMAFVLVQHLDPKHHSLLPDLLQKITPIPVLEISDDIKVKPDHIYIIPSNKMMIARDGLLSLSPRSRKKDERNLPIDLFFTSLAEVYQSHSIGVVLSGTASDGTRGLKAIKDHGGITIAQSEASAEFDGMPHSAIQSGVVDFILPPDEIPKKLVEITRIINTNGNGVENIVQPESEVYQQILALLRVRKGTDFTYYKQSTIRRRILRRIALNKNEDPATYLSYLKENKPEQDILYQDLLIPVTGFFRDPQVFDHLCSTVIPSLEKNLSENKSIRVWIAGCSTGEEAYSIAICLKEFLGKDQERVQIFATDISEPAIAKARAGVYSKSETDDISATRLQDFFTKINGVYRVKKPIRDMCVFAVHNFLKDPPFGRMDLITCRNVLIYMEPYLQKKALTTFHYSLNPDGYLLLGKSETISSVPDLFSTVTKGDKLFSRKDMPAKFMHIATVRSERNLTEMNLNPKTDPEVPGRTDFQKLADEIILSKYTPAGVVVNEYLDIVHFRGKTSNYLEQLQGKPSHNLLKLAKNGLAFELRNILHKARKEKKIIIKPNIPIQIRDMLYSITIEAIPLPNTIDPYYLILFHENDQTGSIHPGKRIKKDGRLKFKEDDKDLLIQQLEQELAQIRDDMRAITEDQEAVNEELQSANEELLSSGEEMQSLNEELETGKEELQSTNEELTVVNHEMISLNEQVTAARDYAENIIANVRESLIVLDKNQRVITANRSFYKTFLVNEQETEGTLIYDIGNRQWNIPALRTMLEKVESEKIIFNDFEVTHTFSHIGERTMLLNARFITDKKNINSLILVSIEDITEKKKAQEIITRSNHRLQQLVKNLPAGVYSCDVQGRINFYNEAALKLWGRKPETGKDQWCGPWKMYQPDGSQLPVGSYPMAVAIKEGRFIVGEELLVEREDRTRSTVLVYTQPEFDLSGRITGAINMVFDITELSEANNRIGESEKRFRYVVEQSLSPICIFKGADLVLEVANEPVFKIWNVGKEAFGKPLLEVVPEMKDHPLTNLLTDVFQNGVTHHENEWPVNFAGGGEKKKTFYFNFVFQPYREQDESISGVFVFANEVTEQVLTKNKNTEDQAIRNKELEEKVQERTIELRESNDELQRKNKELESFNYISSHDLQEPLRKIQLFSNRILGKGGAELPEKIKVDFSRIQEAAKRMQTLLEDLLAYARSNIAEQKLETIDLNDILEETKKEFMDNLADKGGILEFGELCHANINPSQFRQVINNLVSNSLKFSKPGISPHIIIKSKNGGPKQLESENPELLEMQLSPRKKYCHISVSDNGIGFDPKYKHQIFEVFQRLYGKDEYPGTGIGLAIVKKIIENHNGIITATGKPGEGARFDIYIPA